ncbi:glutathione S-transferase U19 [Cryptomeria japonica]|uniref:glutathione S-transferase U19 n=1 Tax=Cryptomeria japonica TaxID=3369 RepID=UPI0027D9E7F5|nr:glutathione S-transferase U19 [Cryptomeria japonica]
MANEDKVKVLGGWGSPYSLGVVIGLEEKGIKYEYVEEKDLLCNKSPLLLKMNPVHKMIPVLIHNGRPVSESAIILQYIDGVWSKSPAFLPSDPYDRAMALFWTDFIDKKICYSGGRRILLGKGEEQEEGKREYIEGLVILEETLKGRDYFGGNTFGMVDIVFVPQICWFHSYEILGDFKIMLAKKFPNIFAWMKKCLERESVKKSLPQEARVLQAIRQFRKDFLKEV